MHINSPQIGNQSPTEQSTDTAVMFALPPLEVEFGHFWVRWLPCWLVMGDETWGGALALH